MAVCGGVRVCELMVVANMVKGYSLMVSLWVGYGMYLRTGLWMDGLWCGLMMWGCICSWL